MKTEPMKTGENKETEQREIIGEEIEDNLK